MSKKKEREKGNDEDEEFLDALEEQERTEEEDEFYDALDDLEAGPEQPTPVAKPQEAQASDPQTLPSTSYLSFAIDRIAAGMQYVNHKAYDTKPKESEPQTEPEPEPEPEKSSTLLGYAIEFVGNGATTVANTATAWMGYAMDRTRLVTPSRHPLLTDDAMKTKRQQAQINGLSALLQGTAGAATTGSLTALCYYCGLDMQQTLGTVATGMALSADAAHRLAETLVKKASSQDGYINNNCGDSLADMGVVADRVHRAIGTSVTPSLWAEIAASGLTSFLPIPPFIGSFFGLQTAAKAVLAASTAVSHLSEALATLKAEREANPDQTPEFFLMDGPAPSLNPVTQGVDFGATVANYIKNPSTLPKPDNADRARLRAQAQLEGLQILAGLAAGAATSATLASQFGMITALAGALGVAKFASNNITEDWLKSLPGYNQDTGYIDNVLGDQLAKMAAIAVKLGIDFAQDMQKNTLLIACSLGALGLSDLTAITTGFAGMETAKEKFYEASALLKQIDEGTVLVEDLYSKADKARENYYHALQTILSFSVTKFFKGALAGAGLSAAATGIALGITAVVAPTIGLGLLTTVAPYVVVPLVAVCAIAGGAAYATKDYWMPKLKESDTGRKILKFGSDVKKIWHGYSSALGFTSKAQEQRQEEKNRSTEDEGMTKPEIAPTPEFRVEPKTKQNIPHTEPSKQQTEEKIKTEGKKKENKSKTKPEKKNFKRTIKQEKNQKQR